MNEKLTAYVLHELPPDEQAELEKQMQQDPALRQEAADMQAFCELLNAQVADKEQATFTPEQRTQLAAAFTDKSAQQNKPVAKIIRPFWRHPAFITTAVAACVTLVFVRNLQDSQKPQTYNDLSDLSPSSKVSVLKEDKPAPKEKAAGRSDNSQLAASSPQFAGEKALREAPAVSLRRAEPAPELLADQPGAARPIRTETAMNSAPLEKTKEFADLNQPAPLQKKRTSGSAAGTGLPTSSSTRESMVLANAKPSDPAATAAIAPDSVDGLLNIAPANQHRLLIVDSDTDAVSRKQEPRSNTESYTAIKENAFLPVAQQPLSTFSIDVDTASYANVRRFLNNGQRPPADAVRLEELINYFPYSYEAPADGKPFSVQVDVAESPWHPAHRLARIALKGQQPQQNDGGANFVFLVDVSGSMDEPDKLPLVQQSLKMLVGKLRKDDRVALAVYAGSSGLVLPSTAAGEKETLLQAIENLKAGGSTNGAGGIRLAYEQAAKHYIKGGVNRVILCTDGDFNVGVSSPEELEKLITEKAKTGVFLSVLGYGTGNLKDRTMETLADKGNGNYAYIDSLSEARKVLVEQMSGTLVTIAKDVKIQVEFNPAQVSAYRLIGYENRALAKEDFNNDRKDAGEIGAGHTVTALYEIVPSNVKLPDGIPLVDDLKYQGTKAQEPNEKAASPQPQAPSPELMTVKLRYKMPEGDKSELLEVPVTDKEKKLMESPRDFQFAVSVAGFGMLLRDSQHLGDLTWERVRELALSGKGEDTLGYRGEFLQLIDKTQGFASPQR